MHDVVQSMTVSVFDSASNEHAGQNYLTTGLVVLLSVDGFVFIFSFKTVNLHPFLIFHVPP